MQRRDEIARLQWRADSRADGLLAGAGIDPAEDFVLPREPRDAIFERADEFHPVVELQFMFDARRGGFFGARRRLSFFASISIRHRRDS